MKRPQDSDIFGTKSTTFAPRIVNEEKIDPNAGFQARMDAQYEAYTRRIGSSHRGAFDERTVGTKVNQEANFDQFYHRSRKDADLQSSIFYEPTPSQSRLIQRPKITERHIPKHAYNQDQPQPESNWGKKETLQRQVRTMPQNTTQFKGNSSSIFGYDEHMDRNGVKNKVTKLIPHQMQWTEHDSVRHQGLVSQGNNIGIGIGMGKGELDGVSESRSEMFDREEVRKKMEELTLAVERSKQNNSNSINMLKKKPPTNPQQKPKVLSKPPSKSTKTLPKPNPKPPTSTQPQKIQISIQKGWSSSIIEQLSKFCRINNTKILSMNFEGEGKGSLVLERSRLWENITDWLRKDAKLKIRVLG